MNVPCKRVHLLNCDLDCNPDNFAPSKWVLKVSEQTLLVHSDCNHCFASFNP